MPAVPGSLMEPIWEQFAVVLPNHPGIASTHPLGCHRRRVPDRVVFEHVVAALVQGSGYERIATPSCSDRTIRRRVHAWAKAELMQQLHAIVLRQYDCRIGLELDDVSVDGCITKAPSGGETAGRNPVDRGKRGLKRFTLTDATGIPCMSWRPGPTPMTDRCSVQRWRDWRRGEAPLPTAPCIWIAAMIVV